MAGSANDAETDKSPWTQPGFVAAGAVVALIVILGLVLLVTGGRDGDARKPAATPNVTAPAPSSTKGGAQASVCGLPAGDQTVPTTTPAHTAWELRGRIATPTSPDTIGPKRNQHGLRSCFAHSPIGALYAAVNAIAMTASPSQREPFLRELTAKGFGRDRALANLRRGAGSDADTSTTLQVAGFSMSDYDERSTVVDLAFRVDKGATTGYVHVPLAMRWERGDWKLAIPDTGEPYGAMARTPNLSGYVRWSGT